MRLRSPWRGQEVCRDRAGHATDSCLEELATQLGALLVISSLVQNALEYGRLVHRQRALRRDGALGRVHTEATLGSSSGAAGGEFFEIAMSYATVALFGGAFPPAAALALLNAALEARTDSFKFLRCKQRPRPQAYAHAGTWRGILQCITLVAILTNTVLVSHTSTALPRALGGADGRGERAYAFALILEHALLLLKLALDFAIPDVPSAQMEVLRLREAEPKGLLLGGRGGGGRGAGGGRGG